MDVKKAISILGIGFSLLLGGCFSSSPRVEKVQVPKKYSEKQIKMEDKKQEGKFTSKTLLNLKVNDLEKKESYGVTLGKGRKRVMKRALVKVPDLWSGEGYCTVVDVEDLLRQDRDEAVVFLRSVKDFKGGRYGRYVVFCYEDRGDAFFIRDEVFGRFRIRPYVGYFKNKKELASILRSEIEKDYKVINGIISDVENVICGMGEVEVYRKDGKAKYIGVERKKVIGELEDLRRGLAIRFVKWLGRVDFEEGGKCEVVKGLREDRESFLRKVKYVIREIDYLQGMLEVYGESGFIKELDVLKEGFEAVGRGVFERQMS